MASPDGRVWHVKHVRDRPSFAESRRQPFFWAGVAATVVMVATVLFIALFDLAIMLLVLVVLVIWLVERLTSLLRPRFIAWTEGPPPERIAWKGGRFGRRRLEKRVLVAIETGNPRSEPPGLTLVTP